MSSKVVEADAGVHSLAMAVAVSVCLHISIRYELILQSSLSPAGNCMVRLPFLCVYVLTADIAVQTPYTQNVI